MCCAMLFSARALNKTFFWRWYSGKKKKTNRNVVYRGLYSYRQRERLITLFPDIFFVLFLYVERVCKSVWKESLTLFQVQVVVFTCQHILIKISLSLILWFSMVCSLMDIDTRHHSGQNVVDSRGAGEWVHNKFWLLWWRVSMSIRDFKITAQIIAVWLANFYRQ